MTTSPTKARTEQLRQEITDQLTTYGHITAVNRTIMSEYKQWPDVAQQLLAQRAAHILQCLDDDQLLAVAQERVKIPDLTRSALQAMEAHEAQEQ